ncbi:hypothetical protein NE237_023435 [Protea cynaroides]|uniref:Uncharacterized protein n=1 Tax=Protea cynaroides TaxID=273540 RepID=A0A9Q0K557_9MAGN|nr:hypothetical protein NE237_023435 [Protea cynaroides]
MEVAEEGRKGSGDVGVGEVDRVHGTGDGVALNANPITRGLVSVVPVGECSVWIVKTLLNLLQAGYYGAVGFCDSNCLDAAAEAGWWIGGSSRFAGSGNGSNMLRFYTDDAPGLNITPTIVLVMIICFIGFVTALNVFGKLYHY